MFSILLLLFSCGGASDSVDSGGPVPIDMGPEPWSELETLPLDSFRLLIERKLDGAIAPERLFALDQRALTAVLDPAAGKVHVLDARYHHSAIPQCLSLEQLDGWEVGDRQGNCPDGQIELERGTLAPEVSPSALVADSEGLAFTVIGRNGLAYRAEGDLLAGNPFDFLRLETGLPLEGASGDTVRRAELVNGAFWVARDDQLLAWDASTGLELGAIELPGAARDLRAVGEDIWVATDNGVWAAGTILDVPATRIGVLGDTVWLSVPDEDQLVSVTNGAFAETELPGLTGALAGDASTGRLYVATEDGVAVLRDGELEAIHETEPPVDLHVTPSHEIVALTPDGTVRVFVDEEALAGGDPLHGLFVTFVEKPRSPDEELGCRDDDQSVQTNVARAATNRFLLDDLPAPALLALTPHASRRIVECGEEQIFRPVWDATRTAHGALFHQEFSECGDDASCHTNEFARELDDIRALGLTPTWVTGLTPHIDIGLEWVSVLDAIQFTPPYLFYSASILPEIPHHSDPRAKDPYPFDIGDHTAARRIASAETPENSSADGAITLYPGDSLSAFTQGGCPNLFILECHFIGAGGGHSLLEDDTEILQLLLHRAVASRSDDTVDTWSFHLPDIGAYDYTTDCSETNRVWSGETCQARALQEWMFDVQARFVANELMVWSIPEELPAPR